MVLENVTELSSQVINRLPAAFLVLCLVNIASMGLVFWFIHVETASKIALMAEITRACFKIVDGP
jgi:hypothetical protein